MSRVLANGNFILAKVNGVKMVLTSTEVQQLINDGYDVARAFCVCSAKYNGRQGFPYPVKELLYYQPSA